jgi:hypothetical protein
MPDGCALAIAIVGSAPLALDPTYIRVRQRSMRGWRLRRVIRSCVSPCFR